MSWCPHPRRTYGGEVRTDGRVLTTLRSTSDTHWKSETTYVGPPNSSVSRWVWQLAWRARHSEAVILRGTSGANERYRDLLAAAAIRVVAPRTRVVMSDATMRPGSSALADHGGMARALAPLLARTLVRWIDSPRVVWCVLSTAEVDRFPRTWGLRRGRVIFTPFAHTLWSGEADRQYGQGLHLFSGGNSQRDFSLLQEAVRGLEVPVVVASSWTPDTVQPDFEVAERTHTDFMHLMATSRAVVLCLEPGERSTGQQTYLNAMALGRPTIVTDSDGVRDHIEDQITGVVVQPTVEALRAAVRDVLDPLRHDFYQAMGDRARDAVLSSFTDEAYRRRLLEIVGPSVSANAAALTA